MATDIRQQRDRFAENPDATATFELLEEHYFLGEEWSELADLYRARLAAPSLAADPPARAEVLLRLGQLLETRLGDESGAIDTYRECASLDAPRRAAFARLRRLYGARGSFATVLQIAELEEPEIREPAERARLFQEMGDIWQRELGDPEQAEQFYARARIERDTAATEAPETHAETGSFSVAQRAWIYAARGDSTSAVEVLRDALERDPSDIEAIDMLVTVLEGADRHVEMADLLERRAALATDLETRAAVLARLGSVRETHLNDQSGARSAFERALGADPANTGARLALERLYRASESWSELRTLLEAVAADSAPDQRVGALCRLGALLEREFDEADGAAAAFEEALAIAPDDATARSALTRMRGEPDPGESDGAQAAPDPPAATENRATRVVTVLERKLEHLEKSDAGLSRDAVKLRLRLAELRGTSLEDIAGAIAVLEPCLEDDDALLAVAQRLAVLYERADCLQAFVALARRAAALAPEPEARAEWYRLAADRARNAGDNDEAAELYRHLLDERPGDRRAEDALVSFHRKRGDVEPLVKLLRGELARAAGRDELPIHLELAPLLEGSLEDPEGALAHWHRALCLDPSQHDVLDRALRCAEAGGGALRQLDVIDHATWFATDDEARARLLARRGDVMADALGWTDEAVESWRRAVALDGRLSEVRARLEAAQASA